MGATRPFDRRIAHSYLTDARPSEDCLGPLSRDGSAAEAACAYHLGDGVESPRTT